MTKPRADEAARPKIEQHATDLMSDKLAHSRDAKLDYHNQ